MSQYNLSRNGYLTTVTGTGYGNKQLSWTELEKLIDGNTTSSGVMLSVSDVLYLSVDMSNRIKIDDIKLYTSVSGISNNIYFYYKNIDSDEYSLLNTFADSTTYYTNISTPSAPRFVSAVVSGVSCVLYELEVLNDDYIVAFGEDGQQYAKYIENADVGEESPISTVPIYNNGNSSIPVNAYVCVDWTGNDADYYIDIANTVDGPWYSLEDGVILDSSLLSDEYGWNMGKFFNTTISIGSNAEKIVISDKTLGSGTYVSSIFEMSDVGISSYFVSDTTIVSGTSVCYSSSAVNTVRVRSSDAKPIEKEECFLCYGGGTFYIYMADPYTNEEQNIWKGVSKSISDSRPYAIDVHRATGRVAISIGINRVGTDSSQIFIYDRFGNELYDLLYHYQEKLMANGGFEFDYSGGIWLYNSTDVYSLMHIDSTLSNVLLDYAPGYDCVVDMSVEIDGDGLWYIDPSSELVMHIDSVGNVLGSVTFNSPTNIASIKNGGCWVFDSTDRKFYKLSSDCTIQFSISSDYGSIDQMVPDYKDGFWYSRNSYVLHRSSLGLKTLEVIVGDSITSLRPGLSGCAVYSHDGKWIKWVDKESGSVSRSYDVSSFSYICYNFIGVLSIDYDYYKKLHIDGSLYPRSTDPIWGDDGSLKWKEVNKDGYFLPRNKYHQIEYKMKTTSSGLTPILNKILMAPALKISDITFKSSKDMYIRANIPASQDIADYETILKCWWSIKE